MVFLLDRWWESSQKRHYQGMDIIYELGIVFRNSQRTSLEQTKSSVICHIFACYHLIAFMWQFFYDARLFTVLTSTKDDFYSFKKYMRICVILPCVKCKLVHLCSNSPYKTDMSLFNKKNLQADKKIIKFSENKFMS